VKYSNLKEFKKANIFGTGIPNFILKNNMTGKSYIKPVKMAGRALMLANVTFAPGSLCYWHIHKSTKGGGQILICTAGEGWYQEEGKEAVSLVPGTVVNIPTNLLHWHGAKKDSWFSHIAVEIGGENVKNEFVSPVSEKDYNQLKDTLSGKSKVERIGFEGEKSNDRPFLETRKLEPGVTDEWHIHKATAGGGQLIVCTAGEGFYQLEGKKVKAIKPGETVYIPAGVKHRHGANEKKSFTYHSIDVQGENCRTEYVK